MKVWRIGTNWGGTDIFPLFKENKIAFAGSEVEPYVKKVVKGDLIAITNGQQIIAIGKAHRITSLSNYDTQYVTDYDNVSCIELATFFTRNENKEIDFGIYDGQGKQFHEAHNDYKRNIISLYEKISNKNMLIEATKLLKYKKQIILQGPPGTGKTKLAKEIAADLIAPKNLGSPMAKVNEFLKNFNENKPEILDFRQQGQSLLNDFFQRFPKEKLGELNLENYPLGSGANDTFCWWLEYGLPMFGIYSGFAQKFLIVYKKEENAFVRTGFTKKAETDEDGMALLAEQIYNVANDLELNEAKKYLGNGFILKILNTYHPEKYFPVNAEKSLNNILKLLGLNPAGLDIIEKSRALQNEFVRLKKENNSTASNVEFMRFLFSNFDLKGDIVLQSNELVSGGEKKIIQFHPSYSYEDFVRGIVAETNENNNLSYLVKNRTFAEFAQNAFDNPSANYVLIIDEINRANLSSVLGELIYALEYRYYFNADVNEQLEAKVKSIYGITDEGIDTTYDLILPENLYVIGTMNTADRSVGHIDYAIRRRFAFVDVLPKDLSNDPTIVFDSNLFNAVSELFDNHITSDFKKNEVQLGHSYFIDKSKEGGSMAIRLEYEIKPILEEYVRDGVLKESALEAIGNLS